MNDMHPQAMASLPMEVVPNVLVGIGNVIKRLGELGISKDRENKEQRFKFRGIDDVLNALNPILSDNYLLIVPRVKERNQIESGKTSKGSSVWKVTVKVEYWIYSSVDGSCVVAESYGEGNDSADKATAKAMSVAYKYLMIQLFCIPTEGTEDGDGDHVEAKGKRSSIKYVTSEEAKQISDEADKAGIDRSMLLTALSEKAGFEIIGFNEIPYDLYEAAFEAINK